MPPSPSLAVPNNSEVSSANFYQSIALSKMDASRDRIFARVSPLIYQDERVLMLSAKTARSHSLPSALVAFVRRAAFLVQLLLATRARTWPTRQLLLQVR
jgi:hypothetical protein